MKIKSTLAISALALLLGACAQPPTSDTTVSGNTAIMVTDHVRTQDQDALIAHEWRLVAATDQAGKPIAALAAGLKSPVTMRFTQTSLHIAGGCNALFGGYQLVDGVLKTQGMAGTMKACPPDLMQLDAAIGAHLKASPQIRLQGQPEARQVVLGTVTGDTLTFAGRLTLEARYGAGETLFLEVAPDLVACSHPLMPAYRCLQVRERRYDASGIQLPPQDDWHPMIERIRGYEHQTGTRTVLRVKRYTDKNPPADASALIYALDMVVEQARQGIVD